MSDYFLLLNKITINQSVMIKFPVCKTNRAIGKASKSKPTNTKTAKGKKTTKTWKRQKKMKSIQGKNGIKPQRKTRDIDLCKKPTVPNALRNQTKSMKINKPKSIQGLRSKLLFWVLATWFGLDLSPQVLFGAYKYIDIDISTHSLIIIVYFV